MVETLINEGRPWGHPGFDSDDGAARSYAHSGLTQKPVDGRDMVHHVDEHDRAQGRARERQRARVGDELDVWSPEHVGCDDAGNGGPDVPRAAPEFEHAT